MSTSADGMIRRWDVAAGREIEPPDGYSGSLHAQLNPQHGGKVELVRLDLASGKVVARTRLETALKGDDSFLDQPRIGADGRS